MPLPGPLVAVLRAHRETQERERKAAGDLWAESDYVFAKPLGGPLSPNTDYHDWKRLLEDAEVRDGRLHDARYTAATVLMLLGVLARVIDQIMGWEPGTSASMRARFLHVPDAIRLRRDHLTRHISHRLSAAARTILRVFSETAMHRTLPERPVERR